MSPFKIFSANKFSDFSIKAIGDHLLREEDKRELLASSNEETPGKALLKGVRSCPHTSWIAFDYSMNPIAVFGYYPLKGIASGTVIWMVATPTIFKFTMPFLLISKRIIKHWLNKFGLLHNFIDTRNEGHIKWLKVMGFDMPEGSVAKLKGVPFQYFKKEKSNV